MCLCKNSEIKQGLSSIGNSRFTMETSRLESSQHAVTPKKCVNCSSVRFFKNEFIFLYIIWLFRKLKHNNIRLAQETGTFACKHCPFRTLYKRSLAHHEKHHSSNHPFQCSFCTFSSKSELNLVIEHINRVHLEELKVTFLLTSYRHFISHPGLVFTYRIKKPNN